MERWTIGEFARRSGLTVKALRLYDEMGLLRPASVDPATGYRGYDADQVPRARLLARLRLAGVPLRDAAPMLDDDAEGRRALLLSHRRRVVADHRIRVDLLDALIATCDQEVSAMTRTTGTTTQPTTRPTPTLSAAARRGAGARGGDLDAVALAVDDGVLAIADGFGAAGDRTAVESALSSFLAAARDGDGGVLPRADAALEAAAAAMAETGEGTGCTLSAVVLDGDRAATAHIGDSRVWLVRSGAVEALTRDHTYVQGLLDAGTITPEEVDQHVDRTLLTRALAPGSPAAGDLTVRTVAPGDRLVLTTDGVHGVLPAVVLATLVTAQEPPESVAVAVEAAVLDAGAPDDWAVIVADVV